MSSQRQLNSDPAGSARKPSVIYLARKLLSLLISAFLLLQSNVPLHDETALISSHRCDRVVVRCLFS